jgi:thioredoxin reductase
MYDVAIVGGGPAGLNAALVLGRCRRRVLLCDAGEPRNQCSARVSGFLSRDGCTPADLRRIGRDQLARYETVEMRDTEVANVEGMDGRFSLTLGDGEAAAARKLILATGLADTMLDIPGAVELFGRGVWTCPYCDGWELQDRPLAVYGRDESAGPSFELAVWSRDVALLTDGPTHLEDGARRRLWASGVTVDARPVDRLEAGPDGMLGSVLFRDGERRLCEGLFHLARATQRSPLVEKLGCEVSSKGTAKTSEYEKTNIPGVWVAGDASRRVQWAIVAAAEGALAAFAVNTELTEEDVGAAMRARMRAGDGEP